MQISKLGQTKRPSRADARLTALSAGTMIATPSGEIAVERLSPGMTVFTRNSGPVRVADVRHALGGRVRAVRIRAGALGNGVPARDVTVAEGQRLMIDAATVKLLFDVEEAMVEAGDLVGKPGIEWSQNPGMGWVSVSLVSDELVLIDGMWAESEPARMAGGIAVPSGRRVLSRIDARLIG